MRDLPRFLVLFGVIVGGLDLRQRPQRPKRELRKGADTFHRNHQRIAAEHGHEPGNACRRHEHAAPSGGFDHPEGFGVFDRLLPDRGQSRMTGDELDRGQRMSHARVAEDE